MTTVSVAIPCYKSSRTIPIVVEDIKKNILSREGYDYQIILVNDYPFDETFDVITQLCEEDNKIIGINLSRNFGQTAAKMAAIPYVTGDVLVYMDDDGQHPANEIYKLVDKVLEGNDVVYAHFAHKKHSLFKRFTSKIHSRIEEINGVKPKGVHISSFHALSKYAYQSLLNYKSPFPSMLGYLNNTVKKCVSIEVEHKERIEGKTNYNLKRLFKLWLDSFTNFSLVPLRIATIFGMIVAFFGFGGGLFTLIRKIVNPNIAAGYTSTISVLLFIGGVIMVVLGLIGEYIGRIYMTVSDKPQFLVREVLNCKIDDKEEKR